MYACTRPTDSHKERSPSGQCAAISIPRGGKLSQAKRERCLWNRHALSFSSFLSSLSRYRSYRDCFRERSTRERGQRCSSRVLLPRCSSTFVCLSPSATESTSSIDRSRKIDFTKRNALWFHRSNEGEGGSFLVDRMSFSLFPLSPFYRFVPLYVVMKGIMKGSRSLPLTRSVLLFPLPRGEEIPSLLVPLPRSTVFVRPRGSPPVAGSVYINVWGQS